MGQTIVGRTIIANATRCSTSVALSFALAASVLAIVARTAAAAETYGCGSDQNCIKIAQTTQCDKACQDACKVYRMDQGLCYTIWGPKLQFRREQEKRGIHWQP
jgi:uncharacterized membrane protein